MVIIFFCVQYKNVWEKSNSYYCMRIHFHRRLNISRNSIPPLDVYIVFGLFSYLSNVLIHSFTTQRLLNRTVIFQKLVHYNVDILMILFFYFGANFLLSKGCQLSQRVKTYPLFFLIFSFASYCNCYHRDFQILNKFHLGVILTWT